jgi:alkylhydroperoxidase family enzyme
MPSAALEPALRMMVSQLAAERSGCRWCIDRGHHRWREAFLPLELLAALNGYRTSALFSARERAALTFADAITRYSESAGGIPAASLAMARAHFTEAEIGALTELVAETHFFNPATGALGSDASPARRLSAWDGRAGSPIATCDCAASNASQA